MDEEDAAIGLESALCAVAIICAIASGWCFSVQANGRALTFALLALIFGIWAK